jgi:hypothetical protein
MTVVSVADELRDLRAHKKLVRAAELGFVCKLRCEMPVLLLSGLHSAQGVLPTAQPHVGGALGVLAQ